jgi:acyl-[acyl carrier protein]--UDP-N-acetylglucosamine O-acyltransferase
VHVPQSCSVGAGTVLLAGTVLTADVLLGRHVVCMPHVTLTHDNTVDDGATLCASATLGGWVHVGSRAYLGMACSVRERVRIGADATVGMGAVVLTDVPAGQTWVGLPAAALAGVGRDVSVPR